MIAGPEPGWLAPSSVEEALVLRSEHGDEVTVLAGGTFLGVLLNQGFLSPSAFLSLGRVAALDEIEVRDGELCLGAMATHTAVERSEVVRAGWSVIANAFRLVASPRVRNQATVGGVLADADYASDPPSVLAALGARVVLRSVRGERSVAVDEFILGHYETCIEPDELLVEARVPPAPEHSVYRKFRSRSTEDRPCVAVAAARDRERLRVVVGAVTDVPQIFPDVCALAEGQPLEPELREEIARCYAERIEPMSDARGSAAYRSRVIAVEVRRALEELAA